MPFVVPLVVRVDGQLYVVVRMVRFVLVPQRALVLFV